MSFPKWLQKAIAKRRKLLEDAIIWYNGIPEKEQDAYSKSPASGIVKLSEKEKIPTWTSQ